MKNQVKQLQADNMNLMKQMEGRVATSSSSSLAAKASSSFVAAPLYQESDEFDNDFDYYGDELHEECDDFNLA
jgi:hypothetical protein